MKPTVPPPLIDKYKFVEDYAEFLDKHELDHTYELEAVYYNKRAHILAEQNDALGLESYRVLQEMSRERYRDALRLVGELIEGD